jgi:hypothetical protein
MALVNGHYLNPGNCQITVERTDKDFDKVVRDCRDYRDALLTLKGLLDDPREIFDGAVPFEFLDDQGNRLERGTYYNGHNLKGEELAIRNLFLEWNFICLGY